MEKIPFKANRILNVILIGLAIIMIRVWHLAVVQHEEKLEESKKPQKKSVMEPAKRGTIRDRFNIPLAINKMQYQAAIVYSQLLQIPSISWENDGGQKIKRYKRREYIKELSELLGEELKLDAERIEDQIYAKAALYNSIPYVIKEDICEEEYYKLKMLEKDWPGLQARSLPKRYYPLGKVGGDVIGYMGAISREEYEKIMHEIKELESALLVDDLESEHLSSLGIFSREEAEEKLSRLVEHAYSVNDYVGKIGVEGSFEKDLRGYCGRRSYELNAKGNFLKKLPGEKSPLSGQRFVLTLSAELQTFAEQLLIQNETLRQTRLTTSDGTKKMTERKPWISGGAIVAMDPYEGDILALASYPRFDPNDFIASGNPEISKEKNASIRRWFETDGYLGEIWDGKRPIEREIYNVEKEKIEEQKEWMTWENYLEKILPDDGPVRKSLKRVKNLKDAVIIQQAADALMQLTSQVSLYPLFNLLYPSPGHQTYGLRLPAVLQEALEEICEERKEELFKAKEPLDKYVGSLKNNYDKVLLIDLCRLIVDANKISKEIEEEISSFSLAQYRQYNTSWIVLESASRELAEQFYHETYFKPWRKVNQKVFLKEKREEEKMLGIKYPKPYLDLLDKKEKEMFEDFWQKHHQPLLLALLKGKTSLQKDDEELLPCYEHFISWGKDLSAGAHLALSWSRAYLTLKPVMDHLSDDKAIALARSFRRYQELNRPLLGRYRYLKRENHLQLEKHLAAAFYPAYGFGYGRSHAYRQSATQGSIFKIVTGYEAMIQKYENQEKKDKSFSFNPFVMVDDTHTRGKAVYVGYDNNGKPIPQLYKGGRIPRSHRSNMGEVDFVRAFEISSNPYFSLLASECLENPMDLAESAKKFGYGKKTGIDLPLEISGSVPNDLDYNRNGLYSTAIGQHSLVVTPLQTAVMLASIANGGKVLKPKIVNMIIGRKENLETHALGPVIQFVPKQVRQEVSIPIEIRALLFEAMARVTKKTLDSAWGSLSQTYRDYPEAISDLMDLKNELLGKSSTSEVVENVNLDLESGTNIYNHTWFGGVLCEKKGESIVYNILDPYGRPELVVVVYLRYGAWGKDTAPVAAQVAQKWREIKAKHALSL